MDELMIKVDGVSKEYRLGTIGGGTLQGDLQSWFAKIRGKEDPNSVIGQKTYRYNEKFLALDHVSFDVKKGERVGIIGHNGAGKSTLLKLLCRVTAPTNGKIYLNGRITSMLEVGTGFHPELTGRENIYLNGAILGMSREEINRKIDDIIEFSECRQFIDTPVKRYSSGMYVKLAFSVAAHLDSDIIIMDEVLAVGDMAFQKKCIDKMNEVSKNERRTVLYVSHNMSTIRQLCERVIMLDHGKIIFDGDPETGINLYLKREANNHPCIDYKDVPRIDWMKNPDVRVLYTEYLNKNSITFEKKEEIAVKLRWVNEVDVKDLCLRIEILKPDETPVGTTLLEGFYSGKKGEITEAILKIPTLGLVKGEYKMNYVFYEKRQYGGQREVEWVQGLNLRIIGEEPLEWHTGYWGNIRYPDLEVLDIIQK